MATSFVKPNLNSLKPGYEIIGIKVDSLAGAGGSTTTTFQEAFAAAPEVLSIVCKTSTGVATASVTSISASQIEVTHASSGAADDVETYIILQGLVS